MLGPHKVTLIRLFVHSFIHAFDHAFMHPSTPLLIDVSILLWSSPEAEAGIPHHHCSLPLLQEADTHNF